MNLHNEDSTEFLVDLFAHIKAKVEMDARMDAMEKDKAEEKLAAALSAADHLLKSTSSSLPPARLHPVTSVQCLEDASTYSEVTIQQNREHLYPSYQGAKDDSQESKTVTIDTKEKESLANCELGAVAFVAKSVDGNIKEEQTPSIAAPDAKKQAKRRPDEAADDAISNMPRRQASVSPPVGEDSIQPLPTGNSIRPRHTSTPGAIPMPGLNGGDLSPSLELAMESAQHDEEQGRSPRSERDVHASEGLVEARAVMDESDNHRIHGEAEEVDLEQREKKRKQQRDQRKKLRLVLGLLLLVALGAIVVGLVMGLRKDEQTDTPTVLPSLAPTVVPTAAPSAAPSSILGTFADNLPNSTIARLEDFDSPQNKAYTWLTKHQSIATMPEWRKVQLFALATFYYAFEGPHWPQNARDSWLDYNKQECFWFSNLYGDFSDSTGLWEEGNPFLFFNDTQCNDNGEFTSITLKQLKLADHNPYIPPEIALLTSLTSILLDMNDIHHSGPHDFIPPEIGQLTHLEFFRIWDNKVAQAIPSEFGLLTKMSILDFDGNKFFGSIPTEFFQMALLEELWLNYNEVTGTIPTQLGMMEALNLLELTDNRLSGSIPSELGLLDKMYTMSFIGNSLLSGTLPTEVGEMDTLAGLWISDTKVSGSIPSELGLVSTMHQLMLSGNFLTSTIPTEVASISNMRQLALGHNYLTGNIPTEVGLMRGLHHLDFAQNFLSGPIPASELAGLVSNHNLSFVNVSGNPHLTGSIHEDLCLMNSHNGTCEYQFWFALAIHLNGMFPCSLGFDCTHQLCGCGCTCSGVPLPVATDVSITNRSVLGDVVTP